MKKKILNIIETLLLIVVVFLCTIYEPQNKHKSTNNNLNNTVNLSTMALKITEFDYNDKYSAKDTFTGDLTGYAATCPACTGYLYCNDKYNVLDGTTTYPDPTYGTVNIVASSKNLACGSIIRFTSPRISDKPVYAIVLDRGVLGNSIDLLTSSEEYAASHIGRSSITYDVLRQGY